MPDIESVLKEDRVFAPPAGFAAHARRVREFLGLSQVQLARLAGISQGGVSRFESGRGLSTPLLVVVLLLHLSGYVKSVEDPAEGGPAASGT